MHHSLIINSEGEIVNRQPCVLIDTRSRSMTILRPQYIDYDYVRAGEGKLTYCEDENKITLSNLAINLPPGADCCVRFVGDKTVEYGAL